MSSAVPRTPSLESRPTKEALGIDQIVTVKIGTRTMPLAKWRPRNRCKGARQQNWHAVLLWNKDFRIPRTRDKKGEEGIYGTLRRLAAPGPIGRVFASAIIWHLDVTEVLIYHSLSGDKL
jgi:hypothetical protein